MIKSIFDISFIKGDEILFYMIIIVVILLIIAAFIFGYIRSKR